MSLNKQKLVNKANLRENNNHIDYDYQVGQCVYQEIWYLSQIRRV